VARQGHDVAIGFRSGAADAETVAAQCRQLGVRALLVGGDVSSEGDVLAMFEAVDDELAPLTGFVNNAGVVAPQARLDTFTAARLHRIVAVNVVGAFLCAREAVKRMSTARGGGGGSIVNVSSAASRLGSPDEYIDYAATKGAIDTLTVGLAKEVGSEGIRVNAVRPGLIRTAIHGDGGEPGRVDRLGPGVPLGRGGEPEEVGALIAWLLSDDASYVSGAIVDVSGGR